MNEQPTETPQSLNLSGESAPTASSGPSTATLEAGRAALNQVTGGGAPPLTASGKKLGRPITTGKWYKHGQRKKERLARKRAAEAAGVPLGNVDSGSGPSFVEDEMQASDIPIDFKPPEPAYDRALAEVYAEPVLDFLSAVGVEFQRMRVKRGTKCQEVADLAASKAGIPEAPRKIMKQGLIDLAEQHKLDLKHAPVAALIIGFSMWQVNATVQAQQVVAEWKAMQAAKSHVA